MGEWSLRTEGGTWFVDGVDAERIVQLSGRNGQRLADLALHQSDLHQAKESLDVLCTKDGNDSVIAHALFLSAFVRFQRCFMKSEGRRNLLLGKKIYPDGLPREVFFYFMNLRNKHVIHDENAWTRSIPMAAIARRGRAYKVERILVSIANGTILNSENVSNLVLLVDTALEWVAREMEDLYSSITRELEALEYDELLSLPVPEYRAPTVDEIGSSRSLHL